MELASKRMLLRMNLIKSGAKGKLVYMFKSTVKLEDQIMEDAYGLVG